MTHEAAEIAKLAEILKRASTEHADLFREAQRACFPKPTRIWEDEEREEWTAEYSQHHERSWAFEAFLEARAYLDAAMSLVPADHFVELGSHEEGWEAVVGSVVNRANAATPALAVTIAALRARAILSEKGEQK